MRCADTQLSAVLRGGGEGEEMEQEEEREEACIHMYTLVLIYTIHARHERQKGGNAKPKRKSEK